MPNKKNKQTTFFSNHSFIGKLKLGICTALLVLITTSIFSIITFNTAIEEEDWVIHSHEVKNNLGNLISYMKDAETATRGYMLTNDSAFLQPFVNAKRDMPKAYYRVQDLIKDNPSQQKRLAAFIIVAQKRLTYLDTLQRQQLQVNVNKLETIRLMNDSKNLMDNARMIISHMITEEETILQKRLERTQIYIKQSRVIIVIFMLVAIIIIAISFYLLLKSINQTKAKEKTYRTVFENSSDLMCVCNDKLEIIEANPLFINVFGLKENEFEQGSLVQYFTNPDDAKNIVSQINQVASIKRATLLFKGKDNSEHICITSFNLMDKYAMTYSVVLTDITQQELIEKEKVALERFANIGKVSRMLAHEVRNPLTNINLAVEAISADNTNEDLLPYVTIIEKNSKRINNIVTELLNSTKPNVPQYAMVDVEKLFTEILVLAKDRIEFQHVTVIKNFIAPLPTIKGDSEKLNLAFLNIIINAIEAMPKENGILHLEAFAANEDVVQINITDNGTGMNGETVQHIFQPFYTKKMNGTGLGLASAQNIILMHKGKIGVNSVPDKGTTFIIQLPVE